VKLRTGLLRLGGAEKLIRASCQTNYRNGMALNCCRTGDGTPVTVDRGSQCIKTAKLKQVGECPSRADKHQHTKDAILHEILCGSGSQCKTCHIYWDIWSVLANLSLSTFIHSRYFYSTTSSPLILRGTSDTAWILHRSFTPKHHRLFDVKLWRETLEWKTCPRSLRGS